MVIKKKMNKLNQMTLTLMRIKHNYNRIILVHFREDNLPNLVVFGIKINMVIMIITRTLILDQE
jgi:hypothetical protein